MVVVYECLFAAKVGESVALPKLSALRELIKGLLQWECR